jgi:ankyrin repeat protein
MAAQHGHQDAVKMLINAGANVSAVNKVFQPSFGYCFIEYFASEFGIQHIPRG